MMIEEEKRSPGEQVSMLEVLEQKRVRRHHFEDHARTPGEPWQGRPEVASRARVRQVLSMA